MDSVRAPPEEDPSVASARVNQYERWVHEPNYLVVAKMASILDLPPAYFYAQDAETARWIALMVRVPASARRQLLRDSS